MVPTVNKRLIQERIMTVFGITVGIVLMSLAGSGLSVAADKTQAWGGKINGNSSSTMRNRNQHARIWIGEQSRGWGAGSRVTNPLTTSSAFHLQASNEAVRALQINENDVITYSTTACGTCVSFQNNGNNFSVINNSVVSTNSGSVTSTSQFNY